MRGAPARLLIIAGSDSSGGAGIQADIKTATALGVFAMTAVTAVTAQDTTRVRAIHPVPASIVGDQIACALDDIGADAIKIGMLGSAETVEAVADVLTSHAGSIPIVLDPVLVSTSGAPLLAPNAIGAMISRLFPLAALVTPNLPETGRLTGMSVWDDEQILSAAQRLRELGASAVLVKGGHGGGERVCDILVGGDGSERFEGTRIETRSPHGAGCTLATAIACGLARRLSLADAVRGARAFVRSALETAPNLGHGCGPLN
ncbi:MAG TPA: bifunctional hydroxymethylpyrimidine kinase/phosphomethylpyrimidine kinase, partial [Rhizomicrobium sp.]